MSSRFFLEKLDGETAAIEDTQVHHIRNVMRMDIGDRLMLFNGKDQQAVGEILSIARSRVELRIVEIQNVSCELDTKIVVAMPLPKSERIRFLVEKLTELGVAKLVPVITSRSEFNAKAASADKLLRYVIEASKQCGRNRLMDIEEPIKFDQLVADERTRELPGLLAVRDGEEFDRSDFSGNDCFVVLIGPEGGLSDEEVGKARKAGWIPISLGPTILRMETAAFKLASILSI